jgi:hypothetical protein
MPKRQPYANRIFPERRKYSISSSSLGILSKLIDEDVNRLHVVGIKRLFGLVFGRHG